MARERTAAPMSGFFKFQKVGQSVAGFVSDYRTIRTVDGTSTFIIMRPVLIHSAEKGKAGPLYERYESAAIGLSTDLKLKITDKDKGAFIRISFTDTEPSRKGNPRKIFLVEELEPAEMRALNESAGKDHQTDAYFPDTDKKKSDNPLEDADDEDDLPF